MGRSRLRNLLRREGPAQSRPGEHGPSLSSTSTHGPQVDVGQAAAALVQTSSSPTSLDFTAITKGTNYGISILFDAGPTALVDIVFVHGLIGNAYSTWLHKDSQTHWPSALLKQDIPDSRILSFGYDADIVNFWSPASQSRLGNHAEDMVGELVRLRERSETEQRKIIFVAHSLGGLVIEYALSYSRNSYETHIHQIERFTSGIAFLGTPHHGSDLAKWGKFGTDIASIVQRPNKDIVAVLEPGSEMLDQVENGFHTVLRKRKDEGREIAVTCFWEELPTAMIGHVVPLHSAKMQSYSCYGIHANHKDMTKFSSRSDRGYDKVLGELLRWKKAPFFYTVDGRNTGSTPGDEVTLTQDLRLTDPRDDRLEILTRKNSLPEGGENFRVSFSLQGIPATHHFVARSEEMGKIEAALLPQPGSRQQQKVFVLHGLGGIGKTQLAIEFARKQQQSFSAALWLDGSSRGKMMQSVANLARRLPQDHLHEASKEYVKGSSTDLNAAVADVLSWFSLPSNGQWLLIIDNVDREYPTSSGDANAFDVRDFFPAADHGSILITSRLASLRRLGAETKLEVVNKDQARRLLDNELGQHSEDLSELVDLIDGLPLALVQAGSYMRETGTSAVDYIRYYKTTWDRLMQKQDQFRAQEYGNRSVWTTWAASVGHVRTTNADAVNLLTLWAFLDNRDVWYELFCPVLRLKIADEVPDWLRRCVGSELDFNECMQTLTRFSLVDSKLGSSSFSVHAVLHQWCGHIVEGDTRWWQRLAVETIASSAPSKVEPNRPALQRRLLPHCDHCIQRANTLSVIGSDDSHKLIGLYRAWGTIGILYSAQGRMKEAEEMYLRALSGFEEAWGTEHTSTLDTVNNLGNLYSAQGRMKEAEEMYLRALSGFEEAWGTEHTSTLDTVNNLGNLYSAQGRMKEAEEMYVRALSGKEKAWGAEHTSTLETVNNLGALYSAQGRMKEAEEMYLRALSGKEKAWGTEHTSTLDTVNNLGNLYSAQGRMKEAEEMYVRALSGKEKAWGAEHTSTLDTVNNLGNLYSAQGRMKEAEEMYLRALSGKEKAWGAEHTSTLDTVNNLGNLYSAQGRMKEAEEMYVRALSGFEKAWGAEHTSTLETVNNLGILYRAQGRMKEAEEMYLRALSGKEKAWGAEHTSTLATVNNLGILYRAQGRMKEAEEMYLRVLSGFEKAYGAEHRTCCDTRYNLACLHRSSGQLQSAKDQFELAAKGYEKLLGPQHLETIDAWARHNDCL